MLTVDHGGEAHEDRCLAALGKYLGAAQCRNVGAGLKHAIRTGTAGVDHPLRYAFAIEALQLLHQLHVLQQHRAVGAAVCEFWLSPTAAPLSRVRVDAAARPGSRLMVPRQKASVAMLCFITEAP
jgi:hypothetical protein